MAGNKVLGIEAVLTANVRGLVRGVMRANGVLNALTGGSKQATAATSGLATAANRSGASMKASGTSIQVATGLIGGFATAAIGAAIALGKLAEAGGRVTTVTQAFNVTTGQSHGSMNSMRASTLGLISDFKLMELSNRAFTLGAVETTAQFNKMAQGAIVLGRAMNENATFAVESLTLGIGRQSRLFLDNLGLIIKVEEAYRNYAVANQLVNTQLSESQQKEAFRLEAFRLVEEETARLGGVVLNAGDAFVQLGVAIRNAKNQMFTILAGSTRLMAFFSTLRIMLDEFATGVSQSGQQTLFDIGRMTDETDIPKLEALIEGINAVLADTKTAAAAAFEPAPIEQWMDALGASFGDLLRSAQIVGDTMIDWFNGTITEDDRMNSFMEEMKDGNASLRAIGADQAQIIALNAAGINSAWELFDEQAKLLNFGKTFDIGYDSITDLLEILNQAGFQIEIIQEKFKAMSGSHAIDTDVLSWARLVDMQRASGQELADLTAKQAVTTTIKEFEELGAQIENVKLQYTALSSAVREREDPGSGSSVPSELANTLPQVLEDLLGRTRTQYDDMVHATEQWRLEMVEQWGALPESLEKVLFRRLSDATFTLRLEGITDQLDEFSRKIADLGRNRAGAGAFRSMLGPARALVGRLEMLVETTDEATDEWVKLNAQLERAKDTLADLETSSLGFFGNLGRTLEDLGEGILSGDILSSAIGNVLSGGISSIISAGFGAIGGLFSMEEETADQKSAREAREKNTAALVHLSDTVRELADRILSLPIAGVTSAVGQAVAGKDPRSIGIQIALRDNLAALGLSLADVEAVASALGITLEEIGTTGNFTNTSLIALDEALRAFDLTQALDTFQGKMSLLGREFELFDIEDPTEQMGRILEILSEFTDLNADQFFTNGVFDPTGLDAWIQDIFNQLIGADPASVAELFGGLSIDEVLGILGQLESLGDAAEDAADSLNEASRVLNAPSGFKVALARFNADGGAPSVDAKDGGGTRGGDPGDWTAGGPDPNGGPSTTITVENLTVISDDPDAILEVINTAVRREARRGGTTSIQLSV